MPVVTTRAWTGKSETDAFKIIMFRICCGSIEWSWELPGCQGERGNRKPFQVLTVWLKEAYSSVRGLGRIFFFRMKVESEHITGFPRAHMLGH